MADKAAKADSAKGRGFGLARLGRETLHDRVYGEVKKAIMGAEIEAGAPMTIRALADALGTSVMPVREALHRLVAERALELLPNRSVTLPVMTPERFEEISRIRMALEGMMAETAALYISPDELKRMAKLNEELIAKIRQKSKRYLAINQEFHFALYHAARMPQAMSIVETLWLQIGPFLRHANAEADLESADFLDHHEAMIAALTKRDGKRARIAIESDIREAAEVIVKALRALQKPAD